MRLFGDIACFKLTRKFGVFGNVFRELLLVSFICYGWSREKYWKHNFLQLHVVKGLCSLSAVKVLSNLFNSLESNFGQANMRTCPKIFPN